MGFCWNVPKTTHNALRLKIQAGGDDGRDVTFLRMKPKSKGARFPHN